MPAVALELVYGCLPVRFYTPEADGADPLSGRLWRSGRGLPDPMPQASPVCGPLLVVGWAGL